MTHAASRRAASLGNYTVIFNRQLKQIFLVLSLCVAMQSPTHCVSSSRGIAAAEQPRRHSQAGARKQGII